MKVKIYSDRGYLPKDKGHFVMLYPFWEKNPEDPTDFNSGRFNLYTEVGSEFFQMVNLDLADFAVLPAAWESYIGDADDKQKAEEFLKIAFEAGKPTIIFFWSDSDENVPYKNTVIFRTSFYRSTKKTNEFAMPSWSVDFPAKYLGSQLKVRLYQDRPVVGFCGLAPSYNNKSPLVALPEWAKGMARVGSHLIWHKEPDWDQAHPDHQIRTRALRLLKKSPLVETNFLIRENFVVFPGCRLGKWIH